MGQRAEGSFARIFDLDLPDVSIGKHPGPFTTIVDLQLIELVIRVDGRSSGLVPSETFSDLGRATVFSNFSGSTVSDCGRGPTWRAPTWPCNILAGRSVFGPVQIGGQSRELLHGHHFGSGDDHRVCLRDNLALINRFEFPGGHEGVVENATQKKDQQLGSRLLLVDLFRS